ncbi:MAG: hypothetical protein OXG92_14260 [Chloroflexi bacterium]|nr:hypothetical protein [Chloroflexota bacterium]
MQLKELNPALVKEESALEEDDDREPTKEEIMEDIRQGLIAVMSGYEGQDAMEFLDELEREAVVNADQS